MIVVEVKKVMIVKNVSVPRSSDYLCQNQVKSYGSVTVELPVLKNTSLEGRLLLVGLHSTDDGLRNDHGDHSNNLMHDAGDDAVDYLTGLNTD